MENELKTLLIVVTVMVLLFIVCIELNTSHELIEGKIDNVKTIYKDNQTIDYMVLYFDDGNTINVYEPSSENTLDLTVNSKQIVKLLKLPWDEHWTIYKIIKIPGE